MKGNNEDSFVYSGPISSASRNIIYVNFARQTHNLCAIKKYDKILSNASVCKQILAWHILKIFWMKILVCLLDLILYVPVNTFSVMSGWFFMGWSSSKQVLMCLGQTHNAVTQMGVYQGAPWYQVKHCTTKPLCTSLNAFGRSSPSDVQQPIGWLGLCGGGRTSPCPSL